MKPPRLKSRMPMPTFPFQHLVIEEREKVITRSANALLKGKAKDQTIPSQKEEAKRVPDPRSQQSLTLATLHLDIAGDIGETEIVPSEIAINAVLSTQ